MPIFQGLTNEGVAILLSICIDVKGRAQISKYSYWGTDSNHYSILMIYVDGVKYHLKINTTIITLHHVKNKILTSDRNHTWRKYNV